MERKILANKVFLFLTEFFAGMSVMAVELGASRLLAPYFSSSQIVWTIIIGTIMIAMALGNIYGGRKADKDPNPDKLYARLIIAGIWIALIPLLGKYVIAGISMLLVFAINTGFLVIAAFVCCMVIFVFPLFLLGTTTPCLVKYTMSSLDDSAKTVGLLNASNTIGSIIGTFVPTFITIPSVGTSITFLIFAGILLILSFVYFISSKIFRVRMPVAAAVFLVCVLFGHSSNFAFWNSQLTYEGESVYNYLQVSEDDRTVSLSTNVLFGVQSVYLKERELTSDYYNYALAAPYMAGVRESDSFSVLILGMGSGTYATQLQRYIGEDLSIEGVEIDKKITDLAHTYFHMDDRIRVTTYDGRAFLASTPDTYDLIMVDAYQDITIPFQMSSLEFFSLVSSRLTDRGVMVVNLNMKSDREGSINQHLCDTICHAFSQVYTVNVANSTNRLLFASNAADMMSTYSRNLLMETDVEIQSFLLSRVNPGIVPYEKGPYLLTDDKAPVELLGMRVIDDLIRSEVDYYKQVFRERGLEGLLEYLS